MELNLELGNRKFFDKFANCRSDEATDDTTLLTTFAEVDELFTFS